MAKRSKVLAGLHLYHPTQSRHGLVERHTAIAEPDGSARRVVVHRLFLLLPGPVPLGAHSLS